VPLEQASPPPVSRPSAPQQARLYYEWVWGPGGIRFPTPLWYIPEEEGKPDL
jgi:hypothetical protein